MPMTPEEIDALPEYTTAQELKHLKHVRRVILDGGQAYGLSGRQFTRADFKEVNKLIEAFEEIADTEDAETNLNDNDGVALAIFRPAR